MPTAIPDSSAALRQSPKRSVGRGALLMTANSWAKALLQLGSLIVLGRILAPSDYGLLAMVTAITGIAALVGDLGLSLAALQVKVLSQQLKSNLFWVNVLVGTAIGLVIVGVAPLLVLFYGRAELFGLTLLLACAFPLNGMAVQFKVELNRRGEFGKILLSDAGGTAIGLIVAIAAAIAGAGYWALGLQLTVAAVASFVGAALRARWRPSLPRHEAGLRGMLRFGVNTFGLQVVNYVSSNIGNIAVGRFLGAGPLGFYSRAWTLVTLPIAQLASPLTRVVLPPLSRLEGDEFRAALLRLQLVLSYGLLAMLSALAATAPFFLDVVLGHRWTGSAPILETLTIGAAFQSLGYIYYWGFLSRARTGLLFLGELGGRIVMVVLILIAVQHGVVWVAAASATGAFLIWATSTFVTGPMAELGSRTLAARATRPLALFLAAYLVCRAARDLWLATAGIPPIGELAIVVGLWLAVVLAGLTLPPVRRDLSAVAQEGKRLIGGRARPRA